METFSFSVSVLQMTWIFYCLLIVLFYATFLIASLTIPYEIPPMKNLKEIVSSGLPFSLVNFDPIEAEIWNNSKDPFIRCQMTNKAFYMHHSFLGIWLQIMLRNIREGLKSNILVESSLKDSTKKCIFQS